MFGLPISWKVGPGDIAILNWEGAQETGMVCSELTISATCPMPNPYDKRKLWETRAAPGCPPRPHNDDLTSMTAIANRNAAHS